MECFPGNLPDVSSTHPIPPAWRERNPALVSWAVGQVISAIYPGHPDSLEPPIMRPLSKETLVPQRRQEESLTQQGDSAETMKTLDQVSFDRRINLLAVPHLIQKTLNILWVGRLVV